MLEKLVKSCSCIYGEIRHSASEEKPGSAFAVFMTVIHSFPASTVCSHSRFVRGGTSTLWLFFPHKVLGVIIQTTKRERAVL